MHNIFIDNNIIIDFLVEKRSGHKKAIELFKNQKNHEIFCFSYGSLSDINYVLKREYNLEYVYIAKFFKGLAKSSRFRCLSLSDSYLEKTCMYVEKQILNNKKADIEDCSQYFCALENNCELIITNDRDFPKLDIPLKRTNPEIEDYTPQK